jgi:hypothetical protein
MTYAPEHGKVLFDRPHRRRMELPGAPRWCSQHAGKTEDPQPTRDPRHRLLRPKERVPLASLAPGLSALGDRLVAVWQRWRADGTFERLNAALRERLRVRLGTNPLPSAGIADSQSSNTSGVGGEQRGIE